MIGTILLMAAGVYAVRLGGLLPAGRVAPGRWERVLRFVPVATLAALAAASLTGPPDQAAPRLAAAAVAGVAARRFGRMWVCLVTGLGVYALVRLAEGTR